VAPSGRSEARHRAGPRSGAGPGSVGAPAVRGPWVGVLPASGTRVVMVRARSGVAGGFGEGRRFDDRAEIGLAMAEPGTTLAEGPRRPSAWPPPVPQALSSQGSQEWKLERLRGTSCPDGSSTRRARPQLSAAVAQLFARRGSATSVPDIAASQVDRWSSGTESESVSSTPRAPRALRVAQVGGACSS
jgi:hypothetical protein